MDGQAAESEENKAAESKSSTLIDLHLPWLLQLEWSDGTADMADVDCAYVMDSALRILLYLDFPNTESVNILQGIVDLVNSLEKTK